MKLSALAALRDLKRSRGLMASRKARCPSMGRMIRTTLQLHDGSIGAVTPETIIREAEWACRFLMAAKENLLKKEWHASVDAYFKAAAIATNIIFTANVNQLRLPEAVVKDMNTVIAEATDGLKKVMKVIAVRKLMHHEKEFHKGQPVQRKGAAAMFRKIMKGSKSCKK
jgi:hypothetical protein